VVFDASIAVGASDTVAYSGVVTYVSAGFNSKKSLLSLRTVITKWVVSCSFKEVVEITRFLNRSVILSSVSRKYIDIDKAYSDCEVGS